MSLTTITRYVWWSLVRTDGMLKPQRQWTGQELVEACSQANDLAERRDVYCTVAQYLPELVVCEHCVSLYILGTNE